MYKYLFLGVVLAAININSQEIEFEKSKVIDSLTVNNSTDTYALYLPSSFNKNIPSAIVYIFEPAARGKVGIQAFIDASEKYNYILVCSNNCKNGPYEDNFVRINNLFETVFNTFKINDNLIYTAGFSGGSRLATAVAVLTNQIQGVIGCGAGFPTYQLYVPTNEDFSYVGLVGDEDMNYQEMFVVKDWFLKLNSAHEIFTYEDEHKWPPSEQMLRAFDWLEIESYKKGVRPVNHEVIDNNYKSNINVAKSLNNDNNIELAVWEYERIIRNYSNYYNLDSINKKIKELKKLKQYKKDVKSRKTVKEEEQKTLAIFMDQFNSEFNSKELSFNNNWWQVEFDKFKNKYLFSDNIYLKKMGKRINYTLHAMLFESGNTELRKNEGDKALFCHKLNAFLFPERPFTFVKLAMDYAVLHDEKNMLINLKLAIDKGFTYKDYIMNTKEFTDYLETDSFKKLMDSI